MINLFKPRVWMVVILITSFLFLLGITKLTASILFEQCSEKNIVNVPGQGKFCLTENDDIIENALRRGGWEKHIQAIMHKYLVPNKDVIDIGAYIGSHTVHLAKGLNAGVVYAFEPQKNIREKLKINIALNKVDNVRVLASALGSKYELSYMQKGPSGNKGGTHICSKKANNPGEVCDKKQTDYSKPIEIKTLDSYNFSNVGLMKIDAEGSELEIIKGAQKTINTSRPILIVETSSRGWKKSKDNDIKTLAALKKLHYTTYHIAGADYLAIPTERVTLNFGKQ